jgi:hypothetical protein
MSGIVSFPPWEGCLNEALFDVFSGAIPKNRSGGHGKFGPWDALIIKDLGWHEIGSQVRCMGTNSNINSLRTSQAGIPDGQNQTPKKIARLSTSN